MPGRSWSCLSSMRATGSAHAPIVSAAVRYARILKTFSPLISSRSAISASTCAIGRLSTRQPIALDAVVEHAGAAGGERLRNRRPLVGWPVAEEASTAARTADLGCGRPCRRCTGDERVDRRRGDAPREPLAVLPLLGDRGPDAVPVAGGHPLAHRRGRVADAFEAVEDEPVAVDVLLRDLPVVRPGVARLARVAEDDAPFEFRAVDIERHACDAVDAELERGHAA